MRSQTKKMMDYCTYCPKMCTFSCPVSEATRDTALTPWGKMQVAGWLTDKAIPISNEMVATSYQCLNCGRCMEYCDHHNDVPSALREIRQLAVENYAAPPEAFAMEKRFSAYNNPYGEDLHKRLRAELIPVRGEASPEVIFFPTCHTLALASGRIETYQELFEKIGMPKVSFFQEEIQCCGEPLLSLGFTGEYQEVAEVQYFSLKGYKLVVTDGAECGYHLKRLYAERHLSLEHKVVHLFEWLEPYFRHANLKIPAKARGRLAYLDPVYLGRFLEIRDIPRTILSQVTGFPPLELSQSGRDTIGTGTEGSYDCVFPTVSELIAKKILTELESRGIGLLITADVKSEAMLRRLSKHVKVQDFFEFLNEHIEKG